MKTLIAVTMLLTSLNLYGGFFDSFRVKKSKTVSCVAYCQVGGDFILVEGESTSYSKAYSRIVRECNASKGWLLVTSTWYGDNATINNSCKENP